MVLKIFKSFHLTTSMQRTDSHSYTTPQKVFSCGFNTNNIDILFPAG